jgi:hypothetical protein
MSDTARFWILVALLILSIGLLVVAVTQLGHLQNVSS